MGTFKSQGKESEKLTHRVMMSQADRRVIERSDVNIRKLLKRIDRDS